MAKLDTLVTTHLADRLLGPNRLAALLTSLAEKRASSDAEVRERARALQAEIAQADDKLRRLYKMVEDGVTDLDDVLGTGSPRSNPSANAPRPRWSGSKSNPRPKSRSKPIRSNDSALSCARGSPKAKPPFRKAYLRSIVDAIEVDDKVIRIHGSKASLEQAVIAGEQIGKGVRSFVRKWRAQGDSNPCFRRERATS